MKQYKIQNRSQKNAQSFVPLKVEVEMGVGGVGGKGVNFACCNSQNLISSLGKSDACRLF
jgi:hypothetical protein